LFLVGLLLTFVMTRKWLSKNRSIKRRRFWRWFSWYENIVHLVGNVSNFW